MFAGKTNKIIPEGKYEEIKLWRNYQEITQILQVSFMMILNKVSWLGHKTESKPEWQKQLSEVFFKKGVLKNFANFTEKKLCWSLLLIKSQALSPATLLKRDSNTGFFLWNLRILKNIYFKEYLQITASAVSKTESKLKKISSKSIIKQQKLKNNVLF